MRRRSQVEMVLRHLFMLMGVGVTAICVLASAVAVASDRAEQRRIRRTPVVDVVEKVRDSVVNISSTQVVRDRSIFGPFFDQIFVVPKSATGSGFVIHADGYIVTNHHVVYQSTVHHVRFADGREYEAKLVARDQRHDLAVLRIAADSPLKPLELGWSDDIMLGEDAIAIGNPFGLENTITRGVISALHRNLDFGNDVTFTDLIQTDASINPGNSGGPLLNAVGELIGVNTAIRPEAENVGFAVPVAQLRESLPGMLNIVTLFQLDLGMEVAGREARVVRVREGGPASRAGVREGDAVRAVNGAPVNHASDYCLAILGIKLGDRVDLSVVRDGRPKSLRVTVAKAVKLDGGELAWRKLGVRLEPLTARAADRNNLRLDSGLVVTEVARGGPAVSRQGVKPGDLLRAINGRRAWPMANVGHALERVEAGDPVSIVFFRFYKRHPPDGFKQRIVAR